MTTVEFDETLLDTLTVTAPRKTDKIYELEKYNQEATKEYDLIHMNLEVEPIWQTEEVLGKATLVFSPYFYPISSITLDALDMDIHKVTKGKKGAEFTYDGSKLTIDLGKEYVRHDLLEVTIEYTAHPSLGHIPNARYRTNDQGLYFVEPSAKFPAKPYQVWTQGETEFNSNWFPTRDKPNEKYTHSIKITVADSLKTLSNGLLVEQKDLPDNKRQDHWIMEKEHAPYLTMIAIGDYTIAMDQWKHVRLQYFVYPEYEASAKSIFNNTPEMLQYFSDLTGVSYPWPKYSQVVVEDFVAGAMENTTAVTFGTFVQKTENELIDNHNDDIVAHEMFHHWFGDYVTCESWANLTLNEGFANYSEYLWIAHKYGEAAAHNKRLEQWGGYIRFTRSRGIHPLIHYTYESKERMFDPHSYNKGGLTLHYLRHIIGDEAFFAGMTTYLKDNAGQTVEIEQLRQAYEKTTGIDLKPFFNQWFLEAGHPDFEIYYNKGGTDLTIDVNQIQDPKTSPPIYAMPLEWEIHMLDGSVRKEVFYTDERKSRFEILGLDPKDVSWINFDPAHVFIGEYLENRDSMDYLTEYRNGDQYDKREALDILRNFVVDESFYREILASETNYINKLIALARMKLTAEDKPLLADQIKKSTHRVLTTELVTQMRRNPELIDEQSLLYLVQNEKSNRVLIPVMKLLFFESKTDFDLYFPNLLNQYPENFCVGMGLFMREVEDREEYSKIWDATRNLYPQKLQNFLIVEIEKLRLDNLMTVGMVFENLSKALNDAGRGIRQKELIQNAIVTRLSDEVLTPELEELLDKYELKTLLN